MRNSQIKYIVRNYLINNYKEYILMALLFIIGLFTGVLIINNCKESQIFEISAYINDFITKFKIAENINKTELIVTSIKYNLFLASIIWLAGTTVIGIPIVLITTILRGLVLGYTISSITLTLGTVKGITFCLTTIFLQNILFIPAFLTLGVSSLKLYKSIIKDKRKENIKLEIIRHTVISIFMIIIMIMSSVIENIISLNILKKIIKYF